MREYINFKPIEIEVPLRDRLGLQYKPFFNDKDATHPKAGTFGMFFGLIAIISGASFVFFNLREKDERINDLIFSKLQREYVAKELNEEEIHPAA